MVDGIRREKEGLSRLYFSIFLSAACRAMSAVLTVVFLREERRT